VLTALRATPAATTAGALGPSANNSSNGTVSEADCGGGRRLSVVTVVSGDPSKLAALRTSVRNAGPCVSLTVIEPAVTAHTTGSHQEAGFGSPGRVAGGGNGGWSNDWKPRLLLNELRRWDRNRRVLFVDGWASQEKGKG
jgi:hypothetical protein